MFSELERQKYEFRCGDYAISLRYDLAALLDLERRGFSYEDIFAEKITKGELCGFLEAGGELPAEPAHIVDTLGAVEVWRHLRAAVLLSMPEYDPLIIDIPPETNEKPDMKRLRCLVCDIMGKSEDFFWHSTMRELLERWQDFAEVKGIAKKPERMLLFDTEGMCL